MIRPHQGGDKSAFINHLEIDPEMKKNGAEHWHALYLDSNLANASSERSLDLNDQAAAPQSTSQLKSLLPNRNGEKKK